MDTPTCPWVTAEDSASWGLSPVPYAVTASPGFSSPVLSNSVSYVTGDVPSNPALSSSSPGNAAPAIQAVITLNLSSPTDLNFLLSGLLVNRTVMPNGKLGVNGWFKPVTNELPTLGFNTVITTALANASQASGGVFGLPQSLAQPPPPPCNWACSLWNTVSGVVSTIVNGVLYVAGAVWNAVVAAATYFNHAVQGLARFAEAAVSAAVAVLKTVAKVLVAALQALLTFIVKEVEALFSPIVNAVTSAMTSYADTLWSDFHPIWKDSNSSASAAINSGDAARFMDDLFGGPFLIAIGLFTVVTIALVVVQTLSLGASFLVTLVEGLIVSAAVTAFLAVALNMVPASLLSAGAVDGVWALFNASQSGSLSPVDSHFVKPDKGATCSAFGALNWAFNAYSAYQLPKDTFAGIQLVKVVAVGVADYTLLTVFPIVNAALGAIGLALAVTAAVIGGGIGSLLSMIALFLSFAGLAYGVYVLVAKGGELREANQFNGVLLGELISGAGTTVSLTGTASGC